MLKTSKVEINIPSDFKIRISKLTDNQGNPIAFDECYIAFYFSDAIGNRYMAIHDPFGKRTLNTILRDDAIYVVFQNYRLSPGVIKCRLCSKTTDSDFSDGTWDWLGDTFDTGIVLKS